MNSAVVNAHFDGRAWTLEMADGTTATGDAVFSSMPLRLLIEALDPAPPKYIRAIAATLRHRSLITVAVALRERHDIPFNWVYTPGSNFYAGRIQNYRRWSPYLCPEGWDGTYLGFEYFLLPHQDLWLAGDDGLGAIVERDLNQLGFGRSADRARHDRPLAIRLPDPRPDPGQKRRPHSRLPAGALPVAVSRSAATGCITTTTRTMRCSLRCAASGSTSARTWIRGR